MSFVARGSPCSELATLPPTKYSQPTASRAAATRSATSSGFSVSGATLIRHTASSGTAPNNLCAWARPYSLTVSRIRTSRSSAFG